MGDTSNPNTTCGPIAGAFEHSTSGQAMTRELTEADHRAFLAAIRDGDEHMVRALIEQGAPANADIHGTTPLFDAVIADQPAMISILGQAEADPNKSVMVERYLGRSLDLVPANPLTQAAILGRLGCVERLLDLGADPRSTDALNRTAAQNLVLSQVLLRGEEAVQSVCSIVARMVELGLPINHHDNEHKSLLYHAIVNNAPGAVVEALLKHGANPYDTEERGTTPMHAACSRESIDQVEALIRHGVNLNLHSPDGEHVLHVVYRHDIFDLIMSTNPTIDARDRLGRTPLAAILNSWTPQSTKKYLAYRLIDAGADLDAADLMGNTPKSIIQKNNLADVASYIAAKKARDAMTHVAGALGAGRR